MHSMEQLMKPTNDKILLCMDMDRTALPNGRQEESPPARSLLRRLARRPELIIAYVSGRRRQLQIEAIGEFELPEPAYSVADVGTSIYQVEKGNWSLLKTWHEEVSKSWHGKTSDDLKALLEDVEALRLQESEAQAQFKLSYFANADADHEAIVQRIEHRLESEGCRASIIWSVDETTDTGLLDILPERADKQHAVEFLMKHTGVKPERMVYAGDSGNDLPVLTSGLQAVLVANATDAVRDKARQGAQEHGSPDKLYLARGNFLGMNGNYAAGILEGLAHFLPETRSWME